jgi:hypothetical protein
MLGAELNRYGKGEKQHAQREWRPVRSLVDHERAFAAIFAELLEKATGA